jgi:hypothetical protein
MISLAIFVHGRLDLGSREIYEIAIPYPSSKSVIYNISLFEDFVA